MKHAAGALTSDRQEAAPATGATAQKNSIPNQRGENAISAAFAGIFSMQHFFMRSFGLAQAMYQSLLLMYQSESQHDAQANALYPEGSNLGICSSFEVHMMTLTAGLIHDMTRHAPYLVSPTPLAVMLHFHHIPL